MRHREQRNTQTGLINYLLDNPCKTEKELVTEL
jgi:hypothetical protein